MTTAGRASEETKKEAKQYAETYGCTYVPRHKRSMRRLHETYQQGIIVYSVHQLTYYAQGMTDPFFFHPDTAMFRMKNIQKNRSDALIEATQLKEGDTFLDCTLGRGSDSIIASYIVGDRGRVVGIEKERVVAHIVERGLQTWQTGSSLKDAALRRIIVETGDALSKLKTYETNTFDVVYLDPMFEETVERSDNFASLRTIGIIEEVTTEWIEEAYRVARRRVVMKDHFRSKRFEQFGMSRMTRHSSRTHFGYLQKK